MSRHVFYGYSMSIEQGGQLTRSRAIEIYKDDVARREVAITYLQAELPNILGENIHSANGSAEEALARLPDEQINRLLESISYTYRMNGVFYTVTDNANAWLDVELPINAITLTGTKPHINDIVYSSQINNRPAAFAEYLADYFTEHPDFNDDPLVLNEFRPRANIDELRSRRLIAAERNNAIEIVDGTHRLLSLAILGSVSVRAYAAVPNGNESISMQGDSTFLTMRFQFEKASSDEEREHVLATCALLAKSSTDSVDAIHTYWIDHARTEVIRDAGRNLLERLRQG